MITVADYGMGNLRNVRRAFESLGQQVLVTDDSRKIGAATLLILPGVGAFGEAIARIDRLGFREHLLSHVKAGKPLLGICLGMQLLFDASEESPGVVGLGILKGTVKRFGNNVKVPHIGWNDVVPTRDSTLFDKSAAPGCFYFVHSYYVPNCPPRIASTGYGVEFASAVAEANVLGVQFHPEKSQAAGMALLSRFIRLG